MRKGMLFLVWIVSAVSVESNCASLVKKKCHKPSYKSFYTPVSPVSE